MVAVLLLAGPAWAGGEVAPVTKRQAREIPSATLKARVLRQLSDVLVEQPRPRTGRKPVKLLTDLGFWTKPRPSSEPNVCQTTSVQFNFEPVGSDLDREKDWDEDLDADTPVTVTDVATTAFYHVLAVGADDMPGGDWRRGRRAKCARLRIGEEVFFTAADAEDASRGAWLLARLRAAADQPKTDFVLKCPERQAACLGVLKDEALWNVQGCRERTAAGLCLNLNLGDHAVEVVYRWTAGAMVIDNVRVDELIVLSHERID